MNNLEAQKEYAHFSKDQIYYSKENAVIPEVFDQNHIFDRGNTWRCFQEKYLSYTFRIACR